MRGFVIQKLIEHDADDPHASNMDSSFLLRAKELSSRECES